MKSPNIYIVSLLYLIVWLQEYFWKNIECTLSWNLKLEIKFKSSDNDNLYSFLWNALLKWAIQLNFATCIQCHLWTKTFNLPCRVYENYRLRNSRLLIWKAESSTWMQTSFYFVISFWFQVNNNWNSNFRHQPTYDSFRLSVLYRGLRPWQSQNTTHHI